VHAGGWARPAAHLAAATPLALWGWRIATGRLGADPVAALTHASGEWALYCLLGCLAMTPLRRLTGWRTPIQYRRMLGLWALAYASLHVAVYLVLDLGGYWAQILDDLTERPYIMVGVAAFVLLLPLAATSTRAAMRRLGRRWGQLHRLVYLIGTLAVLHVWWLTKADLREPLLYAGILGVLLLARWPRRARPAAPSR
jgi:methionine sulfoxide reductase heme-binding subunit